MYQHFLPLFRLIMAVHQNFSLLYGISGSCSLFPFIYLNGAYDAVCLGNNVAGFIRLNLRCNLPFGNNGFDTASIAI